MFRAMNSPKWSVSRAEGNAAQRLAEAGGAQCAMLSPSARAAVVSPSDEGDGKGALLSKRTHGAILGAR